MAWHEFGAGSPLIAIPGIGLPGRAMRPVTANFADTNRVIEVDPFGSGNSEPLSDSEAWEAEMAQSVAELMDELGIEKADVVGHSLGGMVAQRLLTDHPRRLEHVALISSLGRHTAWTSAIYAVRAQLVASMPSTHFALATALLHGVHGPERRGRSTSGDAVSDASESTVDPRGYAQQLEALRAHHLEPSGAATGDQTLIIGAADDLLSPAEQMLELQVLLPGATVKVFPKGSHALWRTDGDAIARCIRSFNASLTKQHPIARNSGSGL